jgi:hypothetical protein
VSDARSRIVDRVKQLAAVAGVTAAGCGGSAYGVVDPMPTPACFSGRPPPKTSAQRSGDRVTVTIDVGDPNAQLESQEVRDDGHDDTPIPTEHAGSSFTFTPPKGVKTVRFNVRAWMPSQNCGATLFMLVHVDAENPTVEFAQPPY